MAIEDKVKDIISEQLGVKKEEIKPESSFIDDLGADSLDTVEVVMALEEEFGVSAAAPAMAAAPVAGAAGAEAAEEKTEFDVVLKDGGSNKIQAIKAIRQLKSDLGLSEAKKFVEEAPQTVLEGANKEDAETAKKVLEEAGCTVELK